MCLCLSSLCPLPSLQPVSYGPELLYSSLPLKFPFKLHFVINCELGIKIMPTVWIVYQMLLNNRWICVHFINASILQIDFYYYYRYLQGFIFWINVYVHLISKVLCISKIFLWHYLPFIPSVVIIFSILTSDYKATHSLKSPQGHGWKTVN